MKKKHTETGNFERSKRTSPDPGVLYNATDKFQHRPALPRLGILFIHSFFSFFKEADGLFCLLHQVFHEHPEVFVFSQSLHLSLVAGQDGPQMLVGVGKQV